MNQNIVEFGKIWISYWNEKEVPLIHLFEKNKKGLFKKLCTYQNFTEIDRMTKAGNVFLAIAKFEVE